MKTLSTLALKSFTSIASLTSITAIASLALTLGLASGAAQAVTFGVDIDTRSLAGTTGSVDFQWNLGAVDPALAASVFSFSSGSTLTSAPVLLSGDVSGALLSGTPLNFAGGAPFNYVYQDLTFGAAIHFLLTLPDSAPAQAASNNASAFFVSVLNANQASALATSSADGTALAFTLAPGAAPTVQAYTDTGVVSVSVVPEPSTVALLLAGLVGIAGLRGRGALRHRAARGSLAARD